MQRRQQIGNELHLQHRKMLAPAAARPTPRWPRTESLLLEANLWPPIQSSLAKLPPRQPMV